MIFLEALAKINLSAQHLSKILMILETFLVRISKENMVLLKKCLIL